MFLDGDDRDHGWAVFLYCDRLRSWRIDMTAELMLCLTGGHDLHAAAPL